MHWIKKIAAVLVGLLGLALFSAWLLLSSSLLAGARGDWTARLLTQEMGQNVEITGGVSIDIGRSLHVVTEGLVLPSQSLTDVRLAEIERLEFDVALGDLLKRRFNLTDIRADGAKIQLVIDKDGTSSWAAAAQKVDANKSSSPEKAKGGNVVDFLAGHDIQFSNSGVTYQDARNGLDLDLLLTSFELSKKDLSNPVILTGVGALNGQKLTLKGNFPQKQPFKVTADFSQISVEFDGTPDPKGYDVGYAIDISMKIAQIAQFLDVFKLEKSLSGTGHVNAVFKKSGGAASIHDLDILVALDGGQSLKLTGELGKLGDPSDITLDTRIRLYPEDKQPSATKVLRGLKLIAIDMQITAETDGPSQRRMVIETNGFVLDTSGVGPPPISFSEISRTPEGRLKIGKLVLRIGPPDANFLVLEGVVADALKLKEIDIKGTLALPVASLIAPSLFQASDALGLISGGFQLIGDMDGLALSNLKAATQDTDLWTLKVDGSIKNALKFRDVTLDVEADVPSGAKLLTALKLEPIETGEVKLATKLSSEGTKWKSEATITVAESKLNFSLDIDVAEPNPVVRGKIESDLIKTSQVSEIFAAALQLEKLDKMDKAAAQRIAPDEVLPDSEDTKKTDPPAQPKSEQTKSTGTENTDGKTSSTASDPKTSGPFRDVTLEPIGRAIILSGMDLSVTIDLKKIEGAKDTSSLTTDLEMKDGKMRFGPMKLEFDEAHFDLSGSMDLNKDPDNLKLSGSTGGWEFGKIMQDLRFKKKASGIVNANFDLAGSHASVKDFLATMSGAATISMRNGSIDSQLLNLSGLGVIPWLFTKERGPAVTIVCVRAPLQISNGRLNTTEMVIETDRVQIVILGDVNLKNKTLDIAGQPRRIGKPLSRSPWPFTVIGSFSNPKVKVKDGPRRVRRADGASTMPERRKICVPDILQLK